MSRVVGALLAVSLCTPGWVVAQRGDIHPTPSRTVRAARVNGAITLDGKLEEAAWQAAEPAGGFTQSQPEEGKPATQRTEVRFLYDDDALYIGARMFDDHGAAGVRSRLVRRDQSEDDADQLSITFDTFHDHLGRTNVTVNPAGVKGDAYGPGGSNTDESWDPVWEVATRVDSAGWTAELRIPFSQLRFPRDSVQTWGLQLVRLVSRLNERSHWAFWHLNESGGPTRFGHLTDLRITRGPERAEVLPYVVGRSSNVPVVDPLNPFTKPHAWDYRMGTDLKYLLTSNLTLTATLNPDFGQVEVDPAVVNLSAFETFFDEKRPFFVEGRGLFQFGGFNCFFCSNVSSLGMFYSRRIGRYPQGASNAMNAGAYADVPQNTTLLGAAKITGRTADGWSVGMLDAATRRERALIQRADGSRTSIEVEPFTNYFVGRLAKDLRGGSTIVRTLATSVVRDLGDLLLATQLNRHAEGFGIETDNWWGGRKYRLMTTLAWSQIAGDSLAVLRAQRSSARYFQRPDRVTRGNGVLTGGYDSSLTALRGLGWYTRLSKESGNWLFELTTNGRTPGFEVNDIAALSRADYAWMGGNVMRQFTKPNRIARSMTFILGAQQQYNFDGDLNDRQGQIFAGGQLRNYWYVNTFYIRRPSLLDERLTRGGPVARRPGTNFFAANINTDSRKRLVLYAGPNYSTTSEGAHSTSLYLSAGIRPASNVSLNLGPSYSFNQSRAQYVTAVSDPTASVFYGTRYVFADLDQTTLSMDTRLSVAFTPTLTLDLYAQPFIGTGRYTNFKEYAQPRGLAKLIYGRDVGTIAAQKNNGTITYTVDPDGTGPAAPFTLSDPDFNFRSLRGNAVLRWEYHPGATLYLVWTQSRSDLAPTGDLDFGRDMSALFQAKAQNIFLLKVNYWLGL